MTATIEGRARALLSPTLADCVQQRTAAGVAKYGQTLDDNHQPDRAKAVHLVQELLDAIQYALWLGDDGLAEMLAADTETIVLRHGLSTAEIMAGGKQ